MNTERWNVGAEHPTKHQWLCACKTCGNTQYLTEKQLRNDTGRCKFCSDGRATIKLEIGGVTDTLISWLAKFPHINKSSVYTRYFWRKDGRGYKNYTDEQILFGKKGGPSNLKSDPAFVATLDSELKQMVETVTADVRRTLLFGMKTVVLPNIRPPSTLAQRVRYVGDAYTLQDVGLSLADLRESETPKIEILGMLEAERFASLEEKRMALEGILPESSTTVEEADHLTRTECLALLCEFT